MKIKKAGYLYIAVTIFISLAGVNTGNNLIYLLSAFLLAYMLLSGWIAQVNLAGIQLEMIFPPEIYACVRTPATIKLTNKKKFMPSFFIYIKLGNRSTTVEFLPPSSTYSCYVNLMFEKRGKTYIEKIVVGSLFPFNFFERYRIIPQKYDLLIYPQPIENNIDFSVVSISSSKNTTKKNTAVAGYESLVSIRDYIPGDPTKFINWKATAKTLSLKVNELEAEKPREVMLDLKNIIVDDIEKLLSHYSHLVLECFKKGIPVGIKTNTLFIKPATGILQKKRLLEILALYGQD